MRTLDPALIALAQAQQAHVQYAFRFTSPQISGASWCYTSPQSISFHGDNYSAARIKVDTREGADGKSETGDFIIECAAFQPFLSLLGGGLPFIWQVEIYETYRDNSGNLLVDLVAEGQLTSAESNDTGFKLTFNALANFLDLLIPKQMINVTDSRIPWADDFGLDPLDAGVAAMLSALVQNIVYSTAASAQPRDYFSNGYLQYTRVIAGQTVTISYPVQTNIPSPDPAHPELGFFVLLSPPRLLTVANPDFIVVPGYDGLAATAKSLGNFYSRLTLTIAQIIATDSTPVIGKLYPIPGGAELWSTGTLQGGVAGIDYVLFPADGEIKFLTAPTALTNTLDLRWLGSDGTPARGFQGFPDLPAYSPVTNSQVAMQASTPSAQAPVVDHYENPYGGAVTSSPIGGQLTIVAATGSSFGTATAAHTQKVTVGGVTTTVNIPATSVTVNGLTAQVVSWSGTKIVIIVPTGASTGPVLVNCTLGNPGGTVTSTGSNLTITGAAGTASIDHVEDLNGNIITSEAISVPIKIIGWGFGTTGTRYVKFGTIQVSGSSWTDGVVTVSVPTAPSYPAAGTLALYNGTTLITGATFTITGTAGAQLIDHYENNDSSHRVISSCTALQKLRIVGNSFGSQRGTGWVKFNGLEVVAGGGQYVSWSATVITVLVPVPHSFPWSGAVTMQTAAGLQSTGPVFNIGAAAGTVWIDSFVDRSTPRNKITQAYPGQLMEIVGENFGGGGANSYVRQLSAPTQDFIKKNWYPYIIVVTAPGAAELAPVHVHTNTGGDSVNDPNLLIT